MSIILAFIYSLDIHLASPYCLPPFFALYLFLLLPRSSRLDLLIPPCIRCFELAFDFFFPFSGQTMSALFRPHRHRPMLIAWLHSSGSLCSEHFSEVGFLPPNYDIGIYSQWILLGFLMYYLSDMPSVIRKFPPAYPPPCGYFV
jgi:hypothetical protein